MRAIPVLICVALFAVVEAANIIPPKMPKPKLNLGAAQNKTDIQQPVKLPEERRKLSLFPRALKKYVVTPKPAQYVTAKPFILTTKRRLMRKIVLQNQPNINGIIRESEAKRPNYMNMKLFNSKPLLEIDNRKTTSEENSEEAKANKEINISTSDEYQTEVYPSNEIEDIKLDDILYKPNPNSLNFENSRQKRLLQVDNVNNNEETGDLIDWNEFIFLEPLKLVKKEQRSPRELEESTTEYIVKPKQPKVKRFYTCITPNKCGWQTSDAFNSNTEDPQEQ